MPSQQKRVRRASVSDALSERSRSLSPRSHMSQINKVLVRPSYEHQDHRIESTSTLPEFVNIQHSAPEENPSLETKNYKESIPSNSPTPHQYHKEETKKSVSHEIPNALEHQDQYHLRNRINDIKDGQYLWGAFGIMLGAAIGAIPTLWRFIGNNILSYEGFAQIILFFSSLTLGLFLLISRSRR